MSLSWFFTSHLTSYEKVELWITRSSLFISFCIIGPTIILILLDLLLWCFRAGQGPSADLIRRSKSGIDLLARKSRSNSGTSVSGAPANLGMTQATKEKALSRENERAVTFSREETHPQGGISNEEVDTLTSVPQDKSRTAPTSVPAKQETTTKHNNMMESETTVMPVETTATPSVEKQDNQANFAEYPRGNALHTLNLGKVIE